MTIPKGAISVRKQMPAPHQKVMLFVSDRSVAIENVPVVGWNTYSDGWWSGLPGNYLDLRRLRWKVTHWMPLPFADCS
jgi:Protein of unknown function (DUF551)